MTALAAHALAAHQQRQARRTHDHAWQTDVARRHGLDADANAMVHARVAIARLLDLPDNGRSTHDLGHVAHRRVGPATAVDPDGHRALARVDVALPAPGLDQPVRLIVRWRIPKVPAPRGPKLHTALGHQLHTLADLGAHLAGAGAHTHLLAHDFHTCTDDCATEEPA